MAHIFFQRLEKRFSTQALLPFNSMQNILDLEKLMGASIKSQVLISL